MVAELGFAKCSNTHKVSRANGGSPPELVGELEEDLETVKA